MGVLRSLFERLRLLWGKAKSERASPREIGLAVALGVFIGCTPAMGLHGWLAVGAASLARLNRLFAFIGSRVSFFLLLPWITLCEVELGHHFRTGSFVALERSRIIDQAGSLLADWILGTLPVGSALALLLGLSAYGIARSRASRKRRRTEHEPDTAPGR